MPRPPPLPASLVTRFALLCLGVWLHAADTLVTATIAPAIVADLHGIAYINWTITLYQVGAIISGSATGALCNRFDIKRVFIAATLAYLAGCVLGALAPSMGVLVASRLAQGLGGGILLSLCYVAIERWYAPTAWGRLFGIVAVVWAGGSLLGPLIGGVFAGSHIWRGAFWAFALQAILLAVLVWATFPAATRTSTDPEPAPQRWPILPLVILSAGTLVIAQAGVTTRVGLSIAGCVLGTGLLYFAARVDARATVRLLPNQLLRLRHPVGAGLMMVFALGVGTTGFWAYGPLLTNILFGTSPLVTAYILAGEALAWSAGTMAVSRASAAAEIPLIRLGALSVALGSAGFAIAVPTGSLGGMVLCSLLQGAGFGVCWPAVVQRSCITQTPPNVLWPPAPSLPCSGSAMRSAPLRWVLLPMSAAWSKAFLAVPPARRVSGCLPRSFRYWSSGYGARGNLPTVAKPRAVTSNPAVSRYAAGLRRIGSFSGGFS